MPVPQLITIDLDDTLWPCHPTIMAAEQQLYAWMQERAGRITDRHDPDDLRRHRLLVRQRRPDIAHDLTALRLASLRELLPAHGYPADLAEQAMRHFMHHRNRVQPYVDAAPVLRRLAESYHLVAVTNGNAEVENTPLRGHFHRSYRAEDVGAAKPDPALFHAALGWCALEPEQGVHVGDDPLCDVEAARRIGMRAVWMNRTGAKWPADLRSPEAEVADLYALKAWLERAA